MSVCFHLYVYEFDHCTTTAHTGVTIMVQKVNFPNVFFILVFFLVNSTSLGLNLIHFPSSDQMAPPRFWLHSVRRSTTSTSSSRSHARWRARQSLEWPGPWTMSQWSGTAAIASPTTPTVKATWSAISTSARPRCLMEGCTAATATTPPGPFPTRRE